MFLKKLCVCLNYYLYWLFTRATHSPARLQRDHIQCRNSVLWFYPGVWIAVITVLSGLTYKRGNLCRPMRRPCPPRSFLNKRPFHRRLNFMTDICCTLRWTNIPCRRCSNTRSQSLYATVSGFEGWYLCCTELFITCYRLRLAKLNILLVYVSIGCCSFHL